MSGLRPSSAPLAFQVLGTWVQMEVATAAEPGFATLDVEVVAVDRIGLYGRVGGRDPIALWPWHRIHVAIGLPEPALDLRDPADLIV